MHACMHLAWGSDVTSNTQAFAHAPAGGVLPLPLIKNKKTVNPRDSTSEPVFQLVCGVVGGGGF